MYSRSDDINLELAELCTSYSQIVGDDVAGMDIAGDVSKVLPRTLEFLINNNVKFTVHSGEFSSICNI
ncbi:hypothetical protein NAI36_09290 [Francisella tularensis subsp. holarctica]|nr:hypothetical protein [Francisella tularensis]MDE4963416.1 hypothetical protein [Francisella tularensis subsp. holarctica]